MARLLAPTLLWDGTTFRRGQRVSIDDAGRITQVGTTLEGDAEQLNGALLPAFVNAHSHAFQFGLRGRAEQFGQSSTNAPDSFWGWREAMYELVDSLDAQRCRQLSEWAFREMIANGFSTVGEFHYIRHTDERRYVLDDAVIAAAEATGIRMALLVACYLTGDIGKPLAGAQSRFDAESIDAYLQRLDALAIQLTSPLHSIGVVAHSVRAVPIESIVRLQDAACERGLPFHIHLEESKEEIASCIAAHGVTPMRLLLDNGVVRENLVAIHCTHSLPDDLREFAQAGGQVCICPVTEANLSDGIADLPTMRKANASLSIGTDLNSRTDPFEELRWLEYVQRLAVGQRGVVLSQDGDNAAGLINVATRGGARALGVNVGAIEPGRNADLLLINHEHPSLAGPSDEHLAAALVFAGGSDCITMRMIGGRTL
jgi:formimidoylglutamate deiminase